MYLTLLMFTSYYDIERFMTILSRHLQIPFLFLNTKIAGQIKFRTELNTEKLVYGLRYNQESTTVISRFFFFLFLEAFEINTNFDWVNQTV